VVVSARRRLAHANTFVGAASTYWLGVFPHVNREIRDWRERAAGIPDPLLRRLALSTQSGERGNLEGAAAFAVLAPREHRSAVVRAVVAFQAVYDYVDTLAELPSPDPVATGHRLHLALLAALDPGRPRVDYLQAAARGQHGGDYVGEMVETCRESLATLPSYPAVREQALEAAGRMLVYQSLNHGGDADDHEALKEWAARLTPAGSGLCWWETAAGAASSMSVFALIAAAADAGLEECEAKAIHDAYFPWIGSLHVLLDSLVDYAADLRSGDHSLVEHYGCPLELARRLQAIAERALAGTTLVAQGPRHAAILAAMASFYLASPSAGSPLAGPAGERVLETMGMLATPTMAVLKARVAAERLLSRHRGEDHIRDSANPGT
jgi:tetraprenyl-beta-curcumene synthase